MVYNGNKRVVGIIHLLLVTTFQSTLSVDVYNNNGQYPAYGTQVSIGGPPSAIAGYTSNTNPFIQSIYQNVAQQQQQQQMLLQQQQQQQQQSLTAQVPAAFVPIQQAYTLAYYPSNFQQTTESPEAGPFVPAPPGQRPYCAKEGQTYCEHVEYYPTKVVLNLLDEDNIENFLINEDRLRIKQGGLYNITPTYFYDYSYTTRANGGNQPYPTNGYYSHTRSKRQLEDEDDMCPTSENFVTARAAENNDGDWKYVVNMPEVDRQLQQLVKVSKCKTTTCRGLCTPPSGSRAVCEQQYVQTRLISLDPTGAKLNNELFKFPHCCLCKIKSPN